MRILQASLGIFVIAIGTLLLLAANGLLVLTLLDIAGITLVLSGFLFWIPGWVWRRTLPWLTSLFIPGSLSFAVGVILLYTSRAGWDGAWYLSTALLVALGAAFLAMYYWGPRARWLWILGITIGGISLFLLALSLSLFAPVITARVVGAVVLIGLGLLFAFSSLAPRKARV